MDSSSKVENDTDAFTKPVQDVESSVSNCSLSPPPNLILDALPPELIAHIFWLSLSEFHPYPNPAYRPFVILSLGTLCHFTRDLVYSTPKLWASITFNLSNWNRNYVPHLSQWLSRAGVSPLELRVDAYTREDWEAPDLDTVLDIISPYFPRCYDLDLRLPFPRPTIFPDTPDSLRSMRSLALMFRTTVFPMSGSGRFKLKIEEEVAPNLDDVVFSGLWFNDVVIPWHNLTALHLSRIYIHECLYVLDLVQIKLQHLVIRQIFSSALAGPDNLDLPAIPDHPIVLHSLTTLDWLGDMNDRVIPVLSAIVTPSLSILRVCPPAAHAMSFDSSSTTKAPNPLSKFIQHSLPSLTTIITMAFPIEELLETWACGQGITVVQLKPWYNKADRITRPDLRRPDLLSLYDTPSSPEWSRVQYFLPPLPL